MRPSLKTAYQKQKIKLIFGRKNQTGRLGSTTLLMKPGFSDWFLKKRLKLCRRADGKHTMCASREEDCLPPRSRRSCASMTYVADSLDQYGYVVVVWCRVFGECCNRDCEENGKALVVATITIRSHPLVVRPEMCTSG